MTEKERVEEFHAYLDENLIQYTCPTPYTVEIGGRVFELYKPAYDGSIFDDAFGFKGLPVDPEHKGEMEPLGDCYAYKFGGVWYWLSKGDENNVKLRRLKYLGKARQNLFDGQGVYLGVHGQYEILSGSGIYADWCSKAKFLNYSALGICELNTLAGALKFQQECQKNGLKPVIGMECTVFDELNGYKFTVKVFVRNVQGWQDILTINKFINCDNPKYISLKDFNNITRGNDNLILILDPKTLDYDNLAQMRIDTVLFQLDPVEYTDNERDRVYLENLKKFFTSKLLPVTMTDAWYLDPEYSSIRQRLNSIGGTQSYDSDDQYMKGDDDVFFELQKLIPEEDNFAEYFYDVYSEARQRLIDIVEGVDFTIDVSHRHLPRYVMTPEEAQKYTDNEDMFWGLIAEGLERHPDLVETWGEDVVMERINREVDTIKYGDTIDYFLITRDMINWCHENGIMTGISRGSAGGCLISYLLGITKLDPLKYNLLFERFLNKGRVQKSLPDVDCDYPGVDRPRVKKYMEDRFGAFQVASVGTYSALQLRAAMKDLSRLYGLQFQEVNEMMKLFSVDDRKPEDLFYKACASSTVKKFVKEHPDLVNEVMLVMPAPKAQSIHACATMIFPTEHDMFRWVPIRKVGNEYVTEWEGTEMDSAGFLKQDVLGIKQLDKFQEMVRLIKENEGVDIDIFSVPLDDPEVYRYFQEGWTEDNFHFGSRGLTGYCQKMKPENIEDLIAAISLYRPGAMENGFHEDYIKRKNGNDGQPIEYWVGTEDILKDTYGIFCISENSQVLCERGLVRIQDIIPGKDKVKTEDGTFQTVYLKKDNGVRDVVKVSSTFGREVICTPDHKILTKKGWIEAQNLVKNDEIVCFFEKPLKEDNLTEKERIEHWLVGFFLAEGTCDSSPYFTVTNEGIANKVRDFILQLFPEMCVDISVKEMVHKSGNTGRTIRVIVKQTHGNNGFFNKNYRPNQFVELLKKWGIWGQTCYTKRLPKRYSLDMVTGLLEGDGCFINQTLKMCNNDLMEDVYFALQSYGIHSSLFSRGKKFTLSWKDNFNKMPLRIFSHKVPTRKFITNYGFGRVKKVEPCEKARVYDLSVENVHSFVVNGSVVSNCYQEQIMELCRALGGLSMVEADDVRKAMVKKKYEALHQYHERFTPYYMEHYGVSEQYAEQLWMAIDKASTYLFNRSHAAAYAITGYISQWLKVHYPIEYWSVAFHYAQEGDSPRYIAEINKTGVCQVKPVDINISSMGVVIDFKSKALYWSLMGVKQVAERAAEQILSERKENGQYWSLTDFIGRHKWKGSAINSRVIKNLILAGAFDGIEGIVEPYGRVELLVKYMSETKSKIDPEDPVLKGCDDFKNVSVWWSLMQKQISGLAFFDYEDIFRKYVPKELFEGYKYTEVRACLETEKPAGYVTIGGYLTDIDVKTTRKGNSQMAKITLENNYDFIEVIAFADNWQRYQQDLLQAKGSLVFISGQLDYDSHSGNNVLKMNKDSIVQSITL